MCKKNYSEIWSEMSFIIALQLALLLVLFSTSWGLFGLLLGISWWVVIALVWTLSAYSFTFRAGNGIGVLSAATILVFWAFLGQAHQSTSATFWASTFVGAVVLSLTMMVKARIVEAWRAV